MWEDIDWQFMSEESSGDEGKINQHPLPWRSKGKLVGVILYSFKLEWFQSVSNMSSKSLSSFLL